MASGTPKSPQELLAHVVRTRREALGLTQAALAVAAGVTNVTIYNYEAQRQFPKGAEQLVALAKALGLKPWQLIFDGEEEPTRAQDVQVIIGSRRFVLVEQG